MTARERVQMRDRPELPERRAGQCGAVGRETFAKQRPSTLIWAMGQTQFATGTANVRASCLLLLANRQRGRFGQRREHFPRPHQRQGATDLGLDVTVFSLLRPFRRAWRHWCRVWESTMTGCSRVS